MVQEVAEETRKQKKRRKQEAEQQAEEEVEEPAPKKKKKKASAEAIMEEVVADEAPTGKKKKKKVEAEAAANAEWWAEHGTEIALTAVSSQWFADHGVAISGLSAPVPAETFKQTGFPKSLIKACEGKFPSPTAIQSASWPLLMAGKDVVGVAKTGSGKTLAFGLPFLAKSELGLFQTRSQPSNKARMVCLAPTRELTMQIHGVLEEFASLASKEEGKYPIVTVVGGLPKGEQIQQIRTYGADIVCGTVGRFMDLSLGDRPAFSLDHVQLLALDEADRMLDMGFVDDVKKIAAACPVDRQTVLFSATWPRAVHKLARSLTRTGETATVTVGNKNAASTTAQDAVKDLDPKDIITEDAPTANNQISQIVECMPNGRAKLPRLLELLSQHKKKKIIIFVLYKKEAVNIEYQIRQKGFNLVGLHGDMTQEARNRSMESYRSNKCRILLATDVASRGLDVRDIEMVINFTFPLTVEDFVHRIGRTARGQATGEAITLFNAGPAEGVQDEKIHAGDLVRILKNANQPVPPGLEKIAGTSGGNKASKKKAHPIYGNFFKDEAEMAKLEAKKVHKTFDDSDDE